MMFPLTFTHPFAELKIRKQRRHSVFFLFVLFADAIGNRDRSLFPIQYVTRFSFRAAINMWSRIFPFRSTKLRILSDAHIYVVDIAIVINDSYPLVSRLVRPIILPIYVWYRSCFLIEESPCSFVPTMHLYWLPYYCSSRLATITVDVFYRITVVKG